MSGIRRETGSWQPIVRSALAVLAGGAALWGISFWVQSQEARKLYTVLKPYFTSESNQAWANLSLSSRVRTGRRVLPALERLQRTSWGISITDLRASGEDDAREAVFRLTAGDTELLDCTVSSPAGDPAGSCSRFRHVLPSAEPRLQTVPLALHLGDQPHAESLTPGRLILGADKAIQVRGHRPGR
jgi:hypothetical protein